MRLRGQDGVSSSGVRRQNSVSVYIGTLGLGDVLRGEDVFCEDVATEGGGYRKSDDLQWLNMGFYEAESLFK